MDKGGKTKAHYISSFRNWVNWCIEFFEDPFEFPMKPLKLILWIQSRFEDAGNIKSLRTWTATINWLCDIVGDPKLYKKDLEYSRYIKALKKQHQEGADQRQPFLVDHISNYIQSLWNEDRSFMSYPNLLKATLAALYFCSMSRPAEIVKSTDDGELRGVKFENYDTMTDKNHNVRMILLTIDIYKNQSSKMIKKKIYLASTKCNKPQHCRCRFIDPYKLIKYTIRERERLIDNVSLELKTQKLTKKNREKLQKKLHNLRISPDNFLFVHEDGNPVKVSFITKLAAEVVAVNKLMNNGHYTAYSFRIGGTTRASIAGLDHPLILRFVGWSASRLADCSQRYMRFAPYILANVPFKMLHPDKKIDDEIRTYDPWSEGLDLTYYNKQ